MSLFENYERRADKVNTLLAAYDFDSLERAEEFCLSNSIDARKVVRETQPIAFDNAQWAYTLVPLLL